MGAVRVIIFHPPEETVASDRGAVPLTTLMAHARDLLVEHQATLFRMAGAAAVDVVRTRSSSFGTALAGYAQEVITARRVRPSRGGYRPDGAIVLGAGAVPLLRASDARRLVLMAASGMPRALTNNRYSSDVCALGDLDVLREVPALPGDNALPRWLAEHAGMVVDELPGRDRLALDLDTPLDLALLSLTHGLPPGLRRLAASERLAVPRLGELRAVMADGTRELLVAGRGSARGLAWLERHAACRVRFLVEERGLRASTNLAQAIPTADARPPRTTLGRLLEARGGPASLAATVGGLADGALLDTRVLLADRLGPDERTWPIAEDRYASDLLRPAGIRDAWLRDLTTAAATAPLPILLGGHTLVGPGLRLLTGA
ncbi:MAG: hypothetical protein ACHQZR_02530 [Candidatus Limnocylindrales bacterium]